MGLFDKKYCDICGEKIGLLGNRKLEDGNLCKKCAEKLSPLFSGRRSATVEEIKAQLAYREENRQTLDFFRPTKTFGRRRKVYIDEAAGTFIVTSSNQWRDANPDIISLSQVTACNADIQEKKEELYRETTDGKRVSYNPPRYAYSYEFTLEILVNSPWFSEIHLDLSDGDCPESKYTDLYRDYERELYELKSALMGEIDTSRPSYASARACAQAAPSAAVGVKVSNAADASWTCVCGMENTGKFCQNCGNKKPEPRRISQCSQCGWRPAAGEQFPKFCPECGAPFYGN